MGYHLKDNEHIFHLIPKSMMYAHWLGHNEVSKVMAPFDIGPFSSDTYPSSLSLAQHTSQVDDEWQTQTVKVLALRTG